ncbi:hypothetical protein AA13595_0103 [Gluconacetobacter johannae DSM 13595]|uniref:FxLYD domain-containing protein n=1 Tax=Gluconacetobacter johannae TaxID=112140 RepID=UPI002156B9E2|nr:FxLYD domain-containing protein [Gluconacetobacter johannae]GBQ79696.1 hypothetical protein AA13595_0103 [Gluconacetobacter johannae DSM 13595]
MHALVGSGKARVLSLLLAALPVLPALPAHAQDIIVREARSVTEAGGRHAIVGTAENQSGRMLQTAKLIFNLYGEHGTIIGSAIDETHDLPPGGRWTFHARAWTLFADFGLAKIRTVPAAR